MTSEAFDIVQGADSRMYEMFLGPLEQSKPWDTKGIEGVCSQSIHNWRSSYRTGGMEALLSNGRKGKAGKPSVFTKQEHQKIANKLGDPKNGLAGFVELQQWIEEEFNKEVKYNTILKYAIRHFGASVKTARKSHVKKDAQAVSTFKKTSRTK